MEEDLLKLQLEVSIEQSIKKFTNVFGIIKKLVRLKATDKSILEEVSEKFKELLQFYKNNDFKLNNFHVYEVRVLVQNRNYLAKIGDRLFIRVSSETRPFVIDYYFYF